MAVFGPLLEFTRIQSEINKLFDHLVDLKRSEDGAVGTWTPNVDVRETQEEWVAECELPGVNVDQVRLSVNENQLILSGEKERPDPGDATCFHCVERGYGKFHRTIHIGATVNPHKPQVEFRNGLLRVRFPKVQNRRGDEVKVPVQNRGGES